jgi:hypothetical protein
MTLSVIGVKVLLDAAKLPSSTKRLARIAASAETAKVFH